jgi:hypothetical protein
MMDCSRTHVKCKVLSRLKILIILLCFAYLPVKGQEKPPRPIGVYFVQNLSFGAFTVGSIGGTVTLSPYGVRYSTGDVILFMSGWPYFPSNFEIEGNPGTVVHLLLGPDIVLTGNTGGTLGLHLGPYTPGDPIIVTTTPPSRTQVYIGGVLTVSNPLINPPGSYAGTFTLMFIQE